jgi:hypothetical protein
MRIPAHQQARIVGRFMHADKVQTAAIGGTNLERILCSALAERHGGHTWFEAREGMGSPFLTTLPLTSTHIWPALTHDKNGAPVRLSGSFSDGRWLCCADLAPKSSHWPYHLLKFDPHGWQQDSDAQ